jgi:xanthine/CO dehydrogenase XdhC/CoxF family maturation factor
MNELHAVLKAWREGAIRHQPAVLATVVHVQGSAYRRPGARMLVLADGSRVGSISGGCLEGDVSRKAWWFTENGRAAVRVYDTSSDGDAVWEFGLGCNGVIHVLLERADSERSRQVLEFLDLCREARREAVVATVIQVTDDSRCAVADRWFTDEKGLVGGNLRGSAFDAELRAFARTSFRERKSHLIHLETCDVFMEFVGCPLPMVIFGAGHDAIPVSAIATQLGWHVTIADSRPAYAQAERFPGASQVVVLKSENPLGGIDINRETAVIMMTHNFPFDQRILPAILARKPRYLGMLGPRTRAESLFEGVGEELAASDIHAPVGLDIGGDAPEAIALSIVAEIQAVVSGRHGGKLRFRQAPIHPPVVESGEYRLTPGEASLPVCELTAW